MVTSYIVNASKKLKKGGDLSIAFSATKKSTEEDEKKKEEPQKTV